MTSPLTWEACAAVGMSKAEAARAMGCHPSVAYQYAKRHGLIFRNGITHSQTSAAGYRGFRSPKISISFDDEAFAQIKAKALRDGTSFAEAVRALCEVGLGRAP